MLGKFIHSQAGSASFLTGADPSTSGHSSTVIGRAPPANLKKVDYYPAVDLLYLVLDTRMLDCWRLQFKGSDGVTPCVDIFKHFADLTAAKSIPGIEELEKIAQHLHRTYTSTRAIYEALDDGRQGYSVLNLLIH
ncbi:hypothetical protein DFP72DRAFT_1074559 [Ephemerocybe angulata]|uniref:DUF6589 domain-containing protein n=1 Tax=Ephemerocybe angulata TaxID=980116 RepID=A0A8H6LZ51_9AGAR|nr:hypothetical protein DFP72DRAFT_1074559 [Tulosesus angulatus]